MDKKLFLGWIAIFWAMAFSTAAERPAGLLSADSDTTARMTVSPEPLTVDTLERLDPVDTDLVTLRRSAGGEEMVIEKFLSMVYTCPRAIIREVAVSEYVLTEFPDFTVRRE